jgi:hypothetical protein
MRTRTKATSFYLAQQFAGRAIFRETGEGCPVFRLYYQEVLAALWVRPECHLTAQQGGEG